MAYRNQLFFKPGELDKNIYRIMPVERLFQCFREQALVLVRPNKWDDPFENLLLSASFQTSDGAMGSMPTIRNSVYGQCWTYHRETDAMWRIYSHEKNGVKVRTTPRKLFEALVSAMPDLHELQCFIGNVQYRPKGKLLEELQNLDLFNTNGSGIAESLLYKRGEFAHEKEVRLIYSSQEDKGDDVIRFRIDPHTLFESIVFDPRMDPDLCEVYRSTIKQKMFPGNVSRSRLYDPPDDLRLSF